MHISNKKKRGRLRKIKQKSSQSKLRNFTKNSSHNLQSPTLLCSHHQTSQNIHNITLKQFPRVRSFANMVFDVYDEFDDKSHDHPPTNSVSIENIVEGQQDVEQNNVLPTLDPLPLVNITSSLDTSQLRRH